MDTSPSIRKHHYQMAVACKEQAIGLYDPRDMGKSNVLLTGILHGLLALYREDLEGEDHESG